MSFRLIKEPNFPLRLIICGKASGQQCKYLKISIHKNIRKQENANVLGQKRRTEKIIFNTVAEKVDEESQRKALTK